MPGWVGLALLVLGYDTWAVISKHPTMSAVYKAGLRNRRAVTMGVTAAVLMHLHEDDLKSLRARRDKREVN